MNRRPAYTWPLIIALVADAVLWVAAVLVFVKVGTPW
jgi:hypothetical protein